MVPVTSMQLTPEQGIASGVFCSPFRQILINTEETLRSFGISPGQLWENILLDQIDIHSIPSGSIIQIGNVQLRLTFHCEPCFKIKHIVGPKTILHQRGYLGQVINAGTIRNGDPTKLIDVRMEAIPYDAVERIVWFLKKHSKPIFASELIWEVGLAPSYCRALPAIIKKHKEIDGKMILFKNDNQQFSLF